MPNINMLDGNFKSFLENYVNIKISDMVKLKGDASYRSYYRILTGTSSYILMSWDPKLTNKSEEACKPTSNKDFPFINICGYLKSINIPVPEIYFASIDKGIILLEDLGDITLERMFSITQDYDLYIKAIKLLAELKKKSLETPKTDCIAFQRKFDYDLYMWEFDHFIEFGIEARNNIKIPENDKNCIRNYFSEISKKLDSVSNIFTHRDYQSRNLMVKNEKLFIIDFQDALLSTPAYDIVALLRDSYVKFESKTVNDFLRFYVDELNKLGLVTDFSFFKELFELQTIQRKLKDGGRFVFIDKIKNNPSFLPYIPTSFTYAAESMKTIPELRELYSILSKYVPEFKELM
ncbi:MAG: phosphotransferase [Deltaproteobacteria bacterium]|nr:phosphotransferase [Deltaproteobacteria bacterium]